MSPRPTDWNPNGGDDLPSPRLAAPVWWPSSVRWEYDVWPHDDTRLDLPLVDYEVIQSKRGLI
jgi:hypothetical protein